MANRLAQLRKEKGLSMAGLATELVNNGYFKNISDATISNYENGKREPKLATWQKLADFFGVPVWYVQGIEEVDDLPINKFLDTGKFYDSNGNLKASNDTLKKINGIAEPTLSALSEGLDGVVSERFLEKYYQKNKENNLSSGESDVFSTLSLLFRSLNEEELSQFGDVIFFLVAITSANKEELPERIKDLTVGLNALIALIELNKHDPDRRE